MPSWEPVGFYAASSHDRYRQLVEWERRTLQPKYGIPLGLSYTLTEGVAELYDFSWFFSGWPVDRNMGGGLNEGRDSPRLIYFPRRGFDLWGGSRYFIVPAVAANDERRANFAFLYDADPVAPTRGTRTDREWDEYLRSWRNDEDWRVYRNRNAFPRSWIVHQVEYRAPIEGYSRQAHNARTSLIETLIYAADLYWNSPNRQVQDLRSKAYVELDDQNQIPVSFRGLDASESAQILVDDDQKVVIRANLKSPGLVVLSDVYYPGWELFLDGKPAPIYRTNRLMRGAAVPSGEHTLVYVYNPQSARLGLALSVFGMLATGGYLGWCRSRPASSRLSDLSA